MNKFLKEKNAWRNQFKCVIHLWLLILFTFNSYFIDVRVDVFKLKYINFSFFTLKSVSAIVLSQEYVVLLDFVLKLNENQNNSVSLFV